MGTATVTGRDELGRLIDITLTTTADVAPPGPEVVPPGGGGLVNPITEPVSIEPTSNASPPLQIVPPANLDPDDYVLNVKDINTGDAFTVTGQGQVQIVPDDPESGLVLFKVDDPRLAANQETVMELEGGSGTLFAMYTDGLLQHRSRDAGAGLVIFQQVATTRPFRIVGTGEGTRKFAVLSGGAPVIAQVAAPADGDINAGELAIWFDASNGASKVMFKGKSADGTVVTGNVALS